MTFKGTLQECFKHYAATLPTGSDRVVGLGRRPLANFLGCNSSTIRDWLKGRQMMGGVLTIKLSHFLETRGYQIEEVEKVKSVSPMSYHLGELIAFDVLTVQGAMELLDYKDSHSILRTVQGLQQPPAERVEKLEEFWRHYKRDVSERRAQLRDKLPSIDVTFVVEESSTTKTSVETSQSTGTMQPHGIVIKMMAGLVNSMRPLAELLASNEFSPEERKQLRDLTGGDGMFNLSNAIMMLCGESARNEFLAQSQKTRDKRR